MRVVISPGASRRIAVLVVAAALIAASCESEPERTVGAPTVTAPAVQVIVPPVTGQGPAAVVPNAGGVLVRGSDGVAFPDPGVTPGDWFEDVTVTEICDPHYSKGIRQPRYNDKVTAFAGYGLSIHDRDIYIVDHLVPIALGGSNAIENLWPQPIEGSVAAKEKDALERQLRGLVCSGTIDLLTARQAIATDWWTAHQTYMGLSILPGTEGPVTWLPTEQFPPGEVANGAPCNLEGAVGFTEPKRVKLTCVATGFGELRWQKRY